jgi:hypothetical protein
MFFESIEDLLCLLRKKIEEAKARRTLSIKDFFRWFWISMTLSEIEQCERALLSLQSGDPVMKGTAIQVIGEFLKYRRKESRNDEELQRRIEEVEERFEEYLKTYT